MIFRLSSIILLTSSLYFVTSPSVNTWDVDTVFEPGTSVPTENELNKCVDAAAKLLLPNFDMQTDPALLKDILENDMHLNEMPEVNKLLSKDLEQKQSLKPLLDEVRKGITVTHPALGVTLCAALSEKETSGIFSSPNHTVIRRSIHHMYLLNKIVTELAEDADFMVKVQEFLQAKVRAMTPHKSQLGHAYDLFKAAGLFGVAKSYTIDGAIRDYKEFRTDGFISKKDSDARSRGLTLNVLEATTSDLFHGYFSNARVGKDLAWQHPTSIQVVGEKKIVKYFTDMNYARLYETWNFAFITGNLEFPNLLYPKLLIPRVLRAEASDYLFNRVLALWLSINFYLMAFLNGHEHNLFEGREALATLWGKINLRYSKYLNANKEE